MFCKDFPKRGILWFLGIANSRSILLESLGHGSKVRGRSTACSLVDNLLPNKEAEDRFGRDWERCSIEGTVESVDKRLRWIFSPGLGKRVKVSVRVLFESAAPAIEKATTPSTR